MQELLASDFEIVTLLGTADFLSGLKLPARGEILEVSESALETLGEFQSNGSALAVARIKPNTPLQPGPSDYAIVSDNIGDPGNLGTIVRTADWYGITAIIASPATADFYNPKVISATMGSFTRVKIYYADLEEYLSGRNLPVYGAFLNGVNVHKVKFQKGGFILIGSESHGVSPALWPFVTEKITIPRYGAGESLNAAIAAAIICDNVRRAH